MQCHKKDGGLTEFPFIHIDVPAKLADRHAIWACGPQYLDSMGRFEEAETRGEVVLTGVYPSGWHQGEECDSRKGREEHSRPWRRRRG